MRSSAANGTSPLIYARITGLAGALALVSGSFAGYVASRLVVRGDATATAHNFVASESLLRLGIAGSLVMMIAALLYALLLYRLLRPVNRMQAILMVALAWAPVPIYMLNQVNLYAALLAGVEKDYEQVKLFLELNRTGNLIAALFFGLWLFPLGLLVFQSGFFPRILGVGLMAGSPGYVILFVQAFLFPGPERTLWSNPFLVLTHVSELALMLWLLIRGLHVERWNQRVGGQAL